MIDVPKHKGGVNNIYLSKIIHYKDEMLKNGVLISFSGYLSHDIIQEMGEAIKDEFKSDRMKNSKYYDIFSVFVEQAQNIINYFNKYASREENNYTELLNSSIICIGIKDKKYFVCSSNYVENKDVDKFLKKLDFIKNKSKDEIKKLYKDQLKKKRENDTYGAGLGILEIVKRSSEPIEYHFNKKDDKYTEFVINTVI